ncbi:sulfotransferase family protein [Rhodobacteraceae bacterium F11138]|nr:sulfotransferase family protein [Rhodobacteraceae bacterium F11138]
MTLLVVNLGLPKTGTTTLARALRRAGMTVADHRLRGRNTSDPRLKRAYVADLLYRGYFETGDPGALLPDCTAISEMSMLRADKSLWPQMDFALILALRAHHPGVRFLASRRDAFELSQSMLAWSDMAARRLPANAVPGLPAGYGATTKERIQWINGHYAALARFFADDPAYLEYDVADSAAPDKIGAFLERPLPWWGRLNANPIRAQHKAG